MDVLELVWVVPIRVKAFVQRGCVGCFTKYSACTSCSSCAGCSGSANACSGACIASTQGADETTSNSYSK